MHERMNLPWGEIPQLRHEYFTKFGTTLKGLQANFNIDPQDYLDFVHDLPLAEYLTQDDKLREMILSIHKRRWILTNSDDAHVQRVLSFLEISDCFEGIIDIYALEPFCKPQREAFQKALEIAGIADPQVCAFLDDSADNITAAKNAGFFTVLVGQENHHPHADRALIDILNLPTIAPELWE